MSGVLVGLLAGIPTGAAFAVLVGVARRQHERRREVLDAYRARLAGELKEYANGVDQRIDAHADQLAGDDLLLRERLRRFQRSGAS